MFAGQPVADGWRLLRGEALTSTNAGPPVEQTSADMVESAVAEEIGALGEHQRPGLEATALALARLIDNPRATSTHPAAAAKLAEILNQLRKRHDGRRGKLAVVRAMASRDLGTR